MRSSRTDRTELVAGQFDTGSLLYGTRKLPKLLELELDDIERNPDQPRTVFDEAGINELAESIRQHGLIQPITVKRKPDGTGYLLVAGERRLRACRKLDRSTITAIVTDGNVDEIGLIENLQREELNAVDQAEAILRLMEKYAYTQEQVGQVIGKARSSISELISIARLPDEIKGAARRAAVSRSVLLEIARLDDHEAQHQLLTVSLEGGSVRAVRGARKSSSGVVATKTPTGQMLQAGRQFLSRLRALKPEELAANQVHLGELRRLKAEIDELYAYMADTA
jgi:ParB family chromosome partitioning protein